MIKFLTGDPSSCDVISKGELLNIASSIRRLQMQGRGITELSINDFVAFSRLTYLYLSNNQLTALQPGIFAPLGSLTHVYLDGNNLGSLPQGLFDHNPNLTYVDLTNNPGTLSDKPLDLWHGVTTARDGRVTSLILNLNNLVGSLPTRFGQLTRLVILELSNNKLYGPLPDLSGMTGLERLNLASNRNLRLAEVGDPYTPMSEDDRAFHGTRTGFAVPLTGWKTWTVCHR